MKTAVPIASFLYPPGERLADALVPPAFQGGIPGHKAGRTQHMKGKEADAGAR